VQMYDHRAADVVTNSANLKRPAQQEEIEATAKARPDRLPDPQFWVARSDVKPTYDGSWTLGFKLITAPTNTRTMIAAMLPECGVGNSMGLLMSTSAHDASRTLPLLLANLASFAFDFVLRQKVQGQNINWVILEQQPVMSHSAFDVSIGKVKIADFVRTEVLHLSYTAHDLAPFARDLGHVDAHGNVLPPFVWDDGDRRHRIARLDALFMRLYGLSPEDAAYILDTFPIVREKDEKAFGRYRTKELVLAYMDRLAAGDLTGVIDA
jgi:hypothetical protein